MEKRSSTSELTRYNKANILKGCFQEGSMKINLSEVFVKARCGNGKRQSSPEDCCKTCHVATHVYLRNA